MEPQTLFVIVLLCGMFSGVFLIVLAMRQRAYRIELLHTERMAMIERGLAPPPELAPSLPADRPDLAAVRDQYRAHYSRKTMTLGIVLIAAGLGFMTIVGVAAGEADVAFGVGGAIVIVGAAFVVISQLSQHTGVMNPARRPPFAPPLPPPIDRVE